ncbi:histidine phosphatase family protein [Lysobacter sp. D1-1-M9]|uniref:histidine phosphatase family protein n=2 Tax=Novilysobacter TaxID=3382699 RepID=UPI002FC8AE77
MTRFLLIRHAAIASSGKSLAGRMVGVHLDQRGRRQARALAEQLAGASIAALYSSPLERAVETAEPIATLLGLPVVTCEDFLELAFGQWTDRTFDELATDPRFECFNTLRSCAPVPDGEFMLQAQARMIIGLEKLRLRHPQTTVVVVSHGDLIKAAIAHYAGIPLDLFQRIEIGLASTSIVEVDDRVIRILAVNAGGTTLWGEDPE